MTTKLCLVRHADSVGQEPDAPLSKTGFAQSHQLAQQLSRFEFDAVYVSPFLRARATAEPVALARDLPIITEPDLRERLLASHNLDDWRDHLKRSFDDPDYKLEGAESTNDATTRALAALKKITSSGHAYPVAVSHGNLIACIFRSIDPNFGYTDWSSMGNAESYDVTLKDGNPVNFQRL